MNTTQQCRVKANWEQIGTAVYTLPKYIYQIPCAPSTKMVENLGAIKERSDGRWNYWRFKSDFHSIWFGEGQGTVASKGAAELRVLEGWIVEDGLQAIRDFQEERTLTPEQGCTLSQILSGKGPWPTYILKWGENMPPDILEALEKGEAALVVLKKGEAALVVKDGKVTSVVVYNDIIGMREMSVATMRDLNQRSRYV